MILRKLQLTIIKSEHNYQYDTKFEDKADIQSDNKITTRINSEQNSLKLIQREIENYREK